MIDEQSQEIQESKAQTISIYESSKAITITDFASLDQAGVVLKKIADTKKEIEAKRITITGPLNESLKKTNELFKTIAAPLVEADTLIRGKVSTYRTEQAAIARKEQDRLDKLAAARQVTADKKAEETGTEAKTIVAAVVPEPPKSVGYVQTRKVWKFKLIDATKVPREYLEVNETKIRRAVQDGAREIPGIEIYEDEQIAIR